MNFKEYFTIRESAASIRIKHKDSMFTAYIKGKITGRLIVDTYSKPLSVFKVVAAANYWNGTPHYNEQVWEYLTPFAKIISVEEY